MENLTVLQDIITHSERLKHRDHQLVGTLQLIKAPVFALFDEVGCGKTKQVIDAAQILYAYHSIDTVCVIAPGFARSTWADPDPTLGEVALHAWYTIPNVIHEYTRHYTELDFHHPALHWVVTNYEFIRREPRLQKLMKQLRGRKVWLVIDESWAIKNFSDQMMAVRRLRQQCADRCTILNGTPLADGKPTDLYYQFNILAPEIIGCKNRAEFKALYTIMLEDKTKKGDGRVVGYQNLDKLNAKVAPYVLSRRTRDCFDLPPMLPPVTLSAPLTPSNWKHYCELRDDMVTWLDGNPTVVKQAITKVLRLTQVTSGYLGGLQEDALEDGDVPASNGNGPDLTTMPDWMRARLGAPAPSPVQAPLPISKSQAGQTVPFQATREIGREKLDALLKWVGSLQGVDRILVWCIFKKELARTGQELASYFPEIFYLKGGQKPDERKDAKLALAPGSKVKAAVVGNPKAGGASLNFSGTNIAVYLSNGPALIARTQSIGRIERPGATQPMLIVDVVATGPKGQKTIDHKILKSLKAKDDMAQWTVQQWRDAILEE